MEPKELTKEIILLAKNMHIADKTERLEQNLVRENKIENGSNNFDNNIADNKMINW